MLTNSEIILRILLAGLLGSMVGLEREYQNQPAGLRTHIILVIGACLAMVLSINAPFMFSTTSSPNGDPARIAAQVISGVGFLGAGAILRFGSQIKGLTTAASLWTMAIVGLCVGAGYFFPAVATTATLLVVLTLINMLEVNLIQPYVTIQLTLKADDRVGLLNEIKKVVTPYSEGNNESTSFRVKKNMEERRISIDITIRTRSHNALDDLLEDIADIEGVRSFEIS